MNGAGSSAWRSRSAGRLGTGAPIPHTLRGCGGAEGDRRPLSVVVDVVVMAKKLRVSSFLREETPPPFSLASGLVCTPAKSQVVSFLETEGISSLSSPTCFYFILFFSLVKRGEDKKKKKIQRAPRDFVLSTLPHPLPRLFLKKTRGSGRRV